MGYIVERKINGPDEDGYEDDNWTVPLQEGNTDGDDDSIHIND